MYLICVVTLLLNAFMASATLRGERGRSKDLAASDARPALFESSEDNCQVIEVTARRQVTPLPSANPPYFDEYSIFNPAWQDEQYTQYINYWGRENGYGAAGIGIPNGEGNPFRFAPNINENYISAPFYRAYANGFYFYLGDDYEQGLPPSGYYSATVTSVERPRSIFNNDFPYEYVDCVFNGAFSFDLGGPDLNDDTFTDVGDQIMVSGTCNGANGGIGKMIDREVSGLDAENVGSQQDPSDANRMASVIGGFGEYACATGFVEDTTPSQNGNDLAPDETMKVAIHICTSSACP